jgi:hypothetical protein
MKKMGKGTALAIHLTRDGEIESVQRDKEPAFLRKEFPKWVQERVALVKMLDKGDMIDKPFPALYVNPAYILLWVNKKELTEIGKLIGT